MTKKIVVTAAQKNAAAGLIRRAKSRGEILRPAVSKIANAKIESAQAK